MKKSLLILAALAVLMPATSCKKAKQPAGEVPQSEVRLTENVNKAHQGKISLPKGGTSTIKDIPYESTDLSGYVREINLTGTDKAIVKVEVKDASGKVHYLVTKYVPKPSKVIEGYTYEIIGVGTFTFTPREDGSIDVLAVINGETIETTAQAVPNIPNSDSPAVVNLCRDWTVESIEIAVDGAEFPAGISKTFEGAEAKDFKKIAEWIAGSGFTIPEKTLNDIAGYSVECISFDASGSFSIDFKAKDSFVGTFTNLDIVNQTFSYAFESYSENLILAARATGSFRFSKQDPNNPASADLCGLTINGAVNYNENKTYNAKVVFLLKGK